MKKHFYFVGGDWSSTLYTNDATVAKKAELDGWIPVSTRVYGKARAKSLQKKRKK